MSERLQFAVDGDCLHVSGRIDVDNAASALARGRESLAKGSLQRIDVTRLESADSVTLAVLLAWAAPSHARGAAIGYVGMSARLQSLAHLSDADVLLGTTGKAAVTAA